MRKISLALALIASLFALPARADFTAKDASLATITFKNPAVCSSVVCVPVFQIYDGTNVVTLTTAGADAVSNTLTGVPMYARNLVFNGTTWDRWTGAVTISGGATSALQTTGNTALTTINTTLGVPMQNSGGSVTANIGTVGTLSTAANQSSQITQETATAAALGTTADTAWVSGSGTTVAILKNIAGGVAGAAPALNATAFNTNSYTTGQTNPLNADLNGNLYVHPPANQSVNTAQVNGVALGSPSNFGTSPGAVAVQGHNASMFYGTTAAVGDPCQTAAKSYLPITATTSLVKVIATGVSAKKIYICQLLLTATAADNVAVFEATTGTTCATSPVAVYGAGTSVATAANGFPFPANGGVSLGAGGFSVGQTTVNNNDLCIGTSAATPLTGGITYVTQ
jgi:hypothetical protein